MRTLSSAIRFKDCEEILNSYLGQAPLAHALFRCAEMAALRRAPLSRPVLDLGCGRGQFAQFALAERVDVGLDVLKAKLNGMHDGCYVRFVEGDGRSMPFADAAFASVVSISALEHIPDPEAVLAEVRRVLRPGGRFVGTVVLSDLERHLFYPRLLRRLGLNFLARWYESRQRSGFHHRTLLTQDQWQELFRGAGLRLLISKRAVSPRLTRLWDMLLPLALPSWLLRRPDVSLLWRPRWLCQLMGRWLEHTLAEETADEGSVLVFVAEKERARASEVLRLRQRRRQRELVEAS